jgi:hypothetical protein
MHGRQGQKKDFTALLRSTMVQVHHFNNHEKGYFNDRVETIRSRFANGMARGDFVCSNGKAASMLSQSVESPMSQ